MNSMEWFSLDLKLISCRHLKAFNFFHKLSVYAVVSIINDEVKKKEKQQHSLQQKKTPIDRKGGSNPEWNHMMQFDLKSLQLSDHTNHLFLQFDIWSECVKIGKISIGEVHVPLKDLLDEFNGAVRFISYQVRSSKGKPNGVLNFSYKVNGKTKKRTIDSPKVDSPSGIKFSSEKVRYPIVEVDHQSRDICYPSLDYVSSTIPGICFHSPGRPPEIYSLSPPPLSPPHMVPLLEVGGVCYHPYPTSPLMPMTGPNWYARESMGYNYGSHEYPGFGQSGMVNIEPWKVGLQPSGSSTTTTSGGS
ncbi:C2 domain-containing protein [Cephalotus follicularis]|uniref:C2 domain-containing protein n=1 Tax=Cephalotus follicularis TaxID=3775 RepID=A0A1Q3CR56_CEPFO|nr:C2 domain-containing protein [Cephalotus follicularis]